MPRNPIAALSICVLLVACLASAIAGDDTQRRDKKKKARSQPTTTTSAPTTTTTSTTTTTAAVDDEEDQPKYFAVINAVVHTVTGPVLEDASVLSKDGVIIGIGRALRLPNECEVLDAGGMHVYPGLVAASAGGIHAGAPADGTDVYGLNMRIGLAAGITSAIAGKHAAKLTFGSVENMVIRENLFVDLKYPARKPLDRAQLVADLQRVRGYLRDLKRHEIEKRADKDAKPPEKKWLKGKYEQFRRLLAHEATAIISANRAPQLRALASLAQRFDFRLVVRGAHEGWIVADELGRAGASVVLNPDRDIAPDIRANRLSGSTIENPKLLHDAGVTVAVATQIPSIVTWGVAGRDLMSLNMQAAYAVRGGMTNEQALRTITIDAARILGIDDRVGSLEVGKDADLIVCDGDLLHYMTLVHHAVVNGRIAYTKSGDSLFAHIRPEGKPAVPQFDDQWPRRLAWPDDELAKAPENEESDQK